MKVDFTEPAHDFSSNNVRLIEHIVNVVSLCIHGLFFRQRKKNSKSSSAGMVPSGTRKLSETTKA